MLYSAIIAVYSKGVFPDAGLLCEDGYCFLYDNKGVNIYKCQTFIAFVPVRKSLYWIQLTNKLLSEQNDSDFGNPNVCAIEKR